MGSISEFIERNFRHFNAAMLKDAADGYIAHLDRGGKMMITLAGAMSTAELGVSLAEMIRRDKVHAITCTGANMEEDLFNLVARSKYERIPNYRELNAQQEQELLSRHLNRVTDTCIPEEEAMRRIEHAVLDEEGVGSGEADAVADGAVRSAREPAGVRAFGQPANDQVVLGGDGADRDLEVQLVQQGVDAGDPMVKAVAAVHGIVAGPRDRGGVRDEAGGYDLVGLGQVVVPEGLPRLGEPGVLGCGHGGFSFVVRWWVVRGRTEAASAAQHVGDPVERVLVEGEHRALAANARRHLRHR